MFIALPPPFHSSQSTADSVLTQRTTYDIPPAVLPHVPPANYHSFQQHSRFQRLTTFVFYNIPGSHRAAESWSFVFIDIPASFPQFLKLLLFLFPCGKDILSQAAVRVKGPANSNSPQMQ
jgi:hypothetical protein